MSGPSDHELEGLVGDALAADREVPPQWREAAHAAYTWRAIDRELLALTFDSRGEELVAVRGEVIGRTLEFAGAGLTLEVELSGDRVAGQLSVSVPGEVVLECADGDRRTTTTDESGFFTLDRLQPGPVRFAVSAGDTRLVTEWIVV